MSTYRRPPLTASLFLDAAGEPIPYGTRWAPASPPEDSYSRISNLERFLPLQTIADALIAHLDETYDVSVETGPGVADELLHPRDDTVRAVRVTPRTGAPLTFVFTAFPSVIVHAGELLELLFPFCGCDACDESVSELSAELEWQVLAVAAGGFHESLDETGTHAETLLEDSRFGSLGGRHSLDDLPAVRVERARAVLADGPRWGAWPLR